MNFIMNMVTRRVSLINLSYFLFKFLCHIFIFIFILLFGLFQSLNYLIINDSNLSNIRRVLYEKVHHNNGQETPFLAISNMVIMSIKAMGTLILIKATKKWSSNVAHFIKFRLRPSTFFILLTCYCNSIKGIDLSFDFVKTKSNFVFFVLKFYMEIKYIYYIVFALFPKAQHPSSYIFLKQECFPKKKKKLNRLCKG